MQPVVNGLKTQYSSLVKFADLDFYDTKNRPLAQQYRVNGHPTFVIIDGQGKMVRAWAGITPVEQLETVLKQVSRS